MGFPPGWQLPLGSRNGIRAVGNAVPVPLAAAIMRAAMGEDAPVGEAAGAAVGASAGEAVGASVGASVINQPTARKLVHRRALRRLKRRVAALERLVAGTKGS
jgi:hypothetical protein